MKELCPRDKTILKLVLGTALLTGCTRVARGNNSSNLPPQTSPATTQTIENPFTPTVEANTPTVAPTGALIPTETLVPPIPYHLFGIDFSDLTKSLTFNLNLQDGTTFKIPSMPTLVCDEYDGFAPKDLTSCEYPFQNDPFDMMHLVHSGWVDHKIPMPAEALRHWLEDSTIDYPATENKLSPEERAQRMAELVRASVQIIQEDGEPVNLKVLYVIRVPPDKLGPFNSSLKDAGSFEDIPETLVKVDPNFSEFTTDGKPEIFITFCGWRIPEEDKNFPPGERPNSYSWSRYVIVVGK